MRYIMVALLLISGCTATNNTQHLDDACFLTPETGYCRAAIPKYYFDNTTKECKTFIWGGCGGTVPFETQGQCEALCKP